MSIELKLTTTKPTDKNWWWVLYPGKMSLIDTWLSSLPGFVSYNQELIDENTRVQYITFDTIENISNYYVQLHSFLATIERKSYNDANGFNTVAIETVV
jgi:hypothetical protein